MSGLLTALIIVLLSLFCVLVYWQNAQFLEQTQSAQLEQHTVQTMTQFVMNEIIYPPAAGGSDVDEAVRVAESLGSSSVAVFVFDAGQHLLAQTYNGEVIAYPLLPVPPHEWPLHGIYLNDSQLVPMTQTITTNAAGQREMVIITPIDLNDQGRFTGRQMLIEQVTSLQTIDTMLGRLRLYLFLGTLLCVVIGVLVGQRLTHVLLRPLARVAATSEIIAAGDLDQRLNLPSGRNEVARLGQSFDHMVDRLASLLATQRRFVADASHELRTPLTSLQALNELLLMGADQGDYRQILRAAHLSYSEIGRLSRLVSDMLTLSRLDSAIPMTKASSAVRPLLLEVCEQMQALAESRQMQLCLVGTEEVSVAMSSDQFKQVMMNLIDNAIRHSLAEGQVVITYASVSTRPWLRLEVIDHGNGIADADLPHIFERFYRGDRSRQHATGNSGLGLAIVQGIVLAHEGTIAVQSTPLVETRFIVDLPTVDESEPL